MAQPNERSLNGDLDAGLNDGRTRHPNPNWGGPPSAELPPDDMWQALHALAPVPGRPNSVQGY